jgi:hypothetical protein
MQGGSETGRAVRKDHAAPARERLYRLGKIQSSAVGMTSEKKNGRRSNPPAVGEVCGWNRRRMKRKFFATCAV